MASSWQREPIASRILSLFNRNASGSKGWRYITCCRLHVFFHAPNGMMYAWNVFHFSLSLSLSFFSILWPDNKFFYFCPSLSKLKYKSMSLHYVLLYIFFLQKKELSFSSRGRNFSLSFVSRLYSGILSMVDWDRKCSFSWKSSVYFLTRKISSADQRMTKQSLWLHRRSEFLWNIVSLYFSASSFFLFGCFIFGTIK